jgi:hypothetical protein
MGKNRRLKLEKDEEPIPPDSPEWKGLPKDLGYIKDETWNRGIGPMPASTFTGRYVAALTPEEVDSFQELYNRLERTGDGERLNRWVNSGTIKDVNEGKHTILTLFSVMDILRTIGKLKVKKKKSQTKFKSGLRFPLYLIQATDQFSDFVCGHIGLSKLKPMQRKRLLQVAQRAKKDRGRAMKFLKNRNFSREKRDAVLWLLESLLAFEDELDD